VLFKTLLRDVLVGCYGLFSNNTGGIWVIQITDNLLNPRKKIQELLLKKDTAQVLEMAGMLHGHYCVGLALGVKAVEVGFTRLGISDNTGMEEIMAVVECNNCFVDGIQFASGCSLGNNALVYKDLGKTAVTFYRRGSDEAVRLCVKSFEIKTGSKEEQKEAQELFDKAVKRREKLSVVESKRLKVLSIQRSFAVIRQPDEDVFTISECDVPGLSFAPIFDSQECCVCAEKVMETKAGFRNGKPICRTCSQEEFHMVLGSGITSGNAVRV